MPLKRNQPKRPQIDVQHLRVFEATLRLRSLTKAADELQLTQSALSKSLHTLRGYFSDPLFVRTPRGMEPTPRATELSEPLQTALRAFDEDLRAPPAFDAAVSNRYFAFYCSDMGVLHFLPRLLAYTAGRAASVQFHLMSPLNADMSTALASGEADLAIGPYPDLGAGIFQQVLYTDHYVCLVSADHPRIRDTLPLEVYLRERHVVVSAHGTGHVHREVERRVLEACPPERIAVRVPGFMAAPYIVQGTDYIATVPRLSAQRLMELGNLRALPCPLPLPTLEIRQYWHERYHHDPANRWLRGIVFELFAGDARCGESDQSSLSET